MHGRCGSGGEDPVRRRRHMRPVPVLATSAAPSPVGPTAPVTSTSPPPLPSDPVAVAANDNNSVSFLKDGRKIRVGDCALFQAGNAPPFIGIIRWFTSSKEAVPRLCVNWLYRPADIKLAKGILLEAAPNEVFYSFHEDVISAASLLHPCKVAFLSKGVELPSGISSFVCWRVYDIAHKNLFWLTDRDYINERQEEVDQLLDKTRVEMHAAAQSGGRSPKPLNAPTSTQQIKSGSESVQNGVTSLPSQTKGKKRERGDQGTEPIKRERLVKTEDGDSANYRLDSMIKTEIAKITEKGALITTEGVEKMVHLMQLGNERKIDLAGRVLLADVIAATEKIECLGRFVHLRGLPVLDDWLQEAHKGKTGDGSSPKGSDKGTEDLLLTLLCALDKLPVNLNALQTCNVGKSVNNLRSHKNLEIQKKARNLVDTWKKRVDAEMLTKINDAKSVGSNQAVTWPVKPGFSEASHAGSRRSGTEATSRSAISQPSACKTLGGKPGHVDSVVKLTVTSGSLKVPSSIPSAVSSKESSCRGAGSTGASELPLSTVKEEKSSGSSQSQNNSQSSWKEDARSSTAGSVSFSKASGGSSRHRRNNGFLGSNNSGVQKENNLGKSGSLNRSTLDKILSQSGLSCERTPEMPGSDHGNGHRLIVRIPNSGCSPARSTSGGSLEEPLVTDDRVSSPGAADKSDHVDRKTKAKVDGSRAHISPDVIAELWQSNDVKEGLLGSDEGDRSPTDILDEERRCAVEAGRTADVPRNACSSSTNQKGITSTEPKIRNSFSSMNALVESCAEYSEASIPVSAGDDIGMNLLASAAAGEMSKSGLFSPSGSRGSSPAKDEPCAGNSESKSRFSREDGVAQCQGQSDENANFDFAKQGKVTGSMLPSQEDQHMSIHFTGNNKTVSPLKENKLTSGQVGRHPNPNLNLYKGAKISVNTEVKCEEEREGKHVSTARLADTREELVSDGICQSTMDETKTVDSTHEKITECIAKNSELACNLLTDGCVNEVRASGRKLEKLPFDESLVCAPSDQVPCVPTLIDKQQSAGNHVEAVEWTVDDAVASSTADKKPCPKIVDESKTKKCHELEVNHFDTSGSGRQESHSNVSSSSEQAASAVSLGNNSRIDEILEKKDVQDDHRISSAGHDEPPTLPARGVEVCAKSTGSNLFGSEPDRREELATSAEASPLIIPAKADNGSKLYFDLNEGLTGDDVNQSEPITSPVPACSSPVLFPSLAPFVPVPLSTGPPAPITVSAPAKGPFVPPEKLMKNKGEPGWKGSAATSAFRPAEPRKVLEMPLNISDVQSSGTTGKLGRAPLDIDLNVPDERVLEDMSSQNSPQTTGSESGAMSNRDAPTRSGGLDLDLNRVDEGTDYGQFLATTSSRFDAPLLGFPNGEANLFRDFDLNNGPGMDEAGGEPVHKSQHVKINNNVPFLAPMAGLRMGNTDLGSVSSWFPPGSSYPATAIPSFLPDRREQPYPIVAAAGAQRILSSVTGGATFGGDVYRGPVLSSSPAMAFSPASAFPYAGFPFGASFPLTSTSFSGGPTTFVDSSSGAGSCFPAIPSQFMGPAAGVSSRYPRPYVVNIPEVSTSAGSESSRKWARQGLDLNSGPGSADIEVKDDRVAAGSRQLPISSSQAFVEEQTRMYQVAGGIVKRKDREGGSWDERFFKQPSWK